MSTSTTTTRGSFAAALREAGLLKPSSVPGLPARSGAFEAVIAGLDGLITTLGESECAEVVRLPPAMPRTAFETTGYMRGFPQLAGSIHCFCGDDATHRRLLACIASGEDWSADLAASEAVLTPAACYPLYPMVAAEGPLPATGRTIDVASWCFRHEPSTDPARMQMFRMREYVRIGSVQQVTDFRQRWLGRSNEIAGVLGLEATVALANDPFFGRAGTLRADSQRAQSLKFEWLASAGDGPAPTACMSFNYHQELFGNLFDIQQNDGTTAHTGCVGFGMERLALAMLYRHGLRPGAWPASIRAPLGL